MCKSFLLKQRVEWTEYEKREKSKKIYVFFTGRYGQTQNVLNRDKKNAKIREKKQ